jgi:hypothetical protein
MATKRSPATAGIAPRADPKFFMIEGITAEENDYLQKHAMAAVAQLFRRRVKRPAKLLSDFGMALRREGLVRVQAKLSCGYIAFEAMMSKKLQVRLRPRKYFTGRDEVYGVVTRAARRSGLDPRLEDITIRLNCNCVEGYVSPVPFIFEERVLDRVVAKWTESNRPGLKRASLRS